jgi:hypothetical protein
MAIRNLWRSVPFEVRESDGRIGRRTVPSEVQQMFDTCISAVNFGTRLCSEHMESCPSQDE